MPTGPAQSEHDVVSWQVTTTLMLLIMHWLQCSRALICCCVEGAAVQHGQTASSAMTASTVGAAQPPAQHNSQRSTAAGQPAPQPLHRSGGRTPRRTRSTSRWWTASRCRCSRLPLRTLGRVSTACWHLLVVASCARATSVSLSSMHGALPSTLPSTFAHKHSGSASTQALPGLPGLPGLPACLACLACLPGLANQRETQRGPLTLAHVSCCSGGRALCRLHHPQPALQQPSSWHQQAQGQGQHGRA